MEARAPESNRNVAERVKNGCLSSKKVNCYGLGPGDRAFESRHSDHVGASSISLAPTFFQKVRARSFRCSSSPNRTRCAGLRFGFLNPETMDPIITLLPRRRKLHIACGDFLCLRQKSHLALISLRLLSKSNPLRWASIWFFES